MGAGQVPSTDRSTELAMARGSVFIVASRLLLKTDQAISASTNDAGNATQVVSFR